MTALIPLLLAQAQPAQAPAPTQQTAYPALQECAAQYARNFAARSRETATVIADAALGACATQEIAFAQTVFNAFPLDRAGSRDAQGTFNFRIERLRRQLIAVVLDERIKRGM